MPIINLKIPSHTGEELPSQVLADLKSDLQSVEHAYNSSVGLSHGIYNPTITEIWRNTSAGGEPIYSTPTLIPYYSDGTYSGPAILYQSWDWFVRLVRADNGTVLYSKAMSAPLYGRASYISFNGATYICGASHAGELFVLDNTLLNRWQHYNLYHNLRGEVSGTGTLTGNTLVDNTKSWAANSFMRSSTNPNVNAFITINGVQTRVASCAGNTLTIASTAGLVDGTYSYTISPAYASDVIFQHAATPSIENGSLYFYQTGFDGQCVKLDINGNIVWKFSAFEAIEPYPVVQDINGDGVLEVIVSSVDWNIYILDSVSGGIISSVSGGEGFDAFITVADTFNDGVLRVISPCRDGRVYSIHGTSYTATKSPPFSGLAGNDIDSGACLLPQQDGTYRIAIANDAGFVAMLDGNMKPIWRQNIGAIVNATPVAFDVDGDGLKEIIVCDMSGGVSIFRQNGEMAGQFFIEGGIEGTPIIEHILGDGTIQMVIPSVEGFITMVRITW